MTRPGQLDTPSIESLPWDLKRGESLDGVNCVKRSRTRCVLRVESGVSIGAIAAARHAIFVKRYLNVYLRRRVGSLLGVSKARSEAETLVALDDRGVRVPRVVGWQTTWRASYVATEGIEGVVALGDALAAIDGRERRSLWVRAGAFTAWLWSRGVVHPDYFEDHVCLAPPLAESVVRGAAHLGESADEEFVLLDVDGVALRAGMPPERDRLLNIVQLLKSCGAERGTHGDRVAFVAAAWEVDTETAGRNIVPRILRLAAARRAITHLE